MYFILVVQSWCIIRRSSSNYKTKFNTHFFTIIKQHGALLAKGRLLGIQFDTLFTDNLYLKIAKNAIEKAEQLKAIFKEKIINSS